MSGRPGEAPGRTLRESLCYNPVELAFGTSGLRGLVRDITCLEAYAATRGFIAACAREGGKSVDASVCLSGDLRPSTERIMSAVARAVTDHGVPVVHLGRIPSPALMAYAVRRGWPSVMVTGSHIPFDRNGIKFTTAAGEVTKAEEPAILAEVRMARDHEYARPAGQSIFDSSGRLRPEHRFLLPPALDEARSEYTSRYLSAFPRGPLEGRRVLVYQHSAVGRDILTEVLSGLGVQVVPAGRSESFVAVDTEAVSESMLADIQDLADANGGGSLDAVVSTDGDSDRPLVLAVDGGRLRFIPGDILGMITAAWLGVRRAVVPVSASDALEGYLGPRGVSISRTRIGSPHVIAAMIEVGAEAGWEANGGFLTSAPLRVPAGGSLAPLATRDALLPILAVLYASLGRGASLAELLSRLPRRFSRSSVLRAFPREKALALIASLSPVDLDIVEARFEEARGNPPRIRAMRAGSSSDQEAANEGLAEELAGIRGSLEGFFAPHDGFARVAWVNWLDGVRVGFGNGEVVHVRPSGNAPELRIYALADSAERVDAIVSRAVAPDGVLRKMEAWL